VADTEVFSTGQPFLVRGSMEPKQAWRAFSLVVLLVDVALAATLVAIGYESTPVIFSAFVVILIYVYVLYKRYHVEVVPESDIKLFDDIDDLRILSRIYGTDEKGDEEALRQRLVQFVRANGDNAFTWVAPRSVLAFGSALELPPSLPAKAPTMPLEQRDGSGAPARQRVLVGGKSRSPSRLADIKSCPVCDAQVAKSMPICPECGADLEFYSVLSESKVGRRIVSKKSNAVRRKLRYAVPSLGETR
jgi:hypothetical protein